MDVSPSVLEFQGSFTNQTTEYLTLTNNTRDPLAFKVKTTAPKLYCVRPNAGLVEPGEDVEISIILQGFSQPLPADYKCKDKFLIVSLPAPEIRDSSRVSDEWSRLESKHGDKLVSKKLRVAYNVTDDGDDDSDYGRDDRREDRRDDRRDRGLAAAGGAGVGAAAGAAASRSRGDRGDRGDRDANGHTVLNQVDDRSRGVAQEPPQSAYQQPAAQQHQAPPPSQYSVPQTNGQSVQGGDYQPQKTITTEPVQGISIQLAALLALLAFLAGWLLF
ncbi:vesicle-associated membrane protein-associated protein Scs2p [Diutina catenulata]